MLDRVLVIQEFALGQTILEEPAVVLVGTLPHMILVALFLLFQTCHLRHLVLKVELASVDPLVLAQSSEEVLEATVQ